MEKKLYFEEDERNYIIEISDYRN